MKEILQPEDMTILAVHHHAMPLFPEVYHGKISGSKLESPLI